MNCSRQVKFWSELILSQESKKTGNSITYPIFKEKLINLEERTLNLIIPSRLRDNNHIADEVKKLWANMGL
jgi:hypothetical protein